MRIEGGLIERKVEDFCDRPSAEVSDKKTKKNRKKQKRGMLQRLYEACRDAFFGPGTIPSPQNIQQLCSTLDKMRPSDLGLNEDMRYFRLDEPGSSPFVTIMPIYECDNFSICIFCLPPAAFIPLHNHPGMTVFSKLLFGSMHIKSYDWVTDVPNGSDSESQPDFQVVASMANSVGPRLAKVHFDGIFTAESDTSVLYPTMGGNLHTFQAITPCAVLDVLGPPYSEADGRDCTYYRSSPCPRASGAHYWCGKIWTSKTIILGVASDKACSILLMIGKLVSYVIQVKVHHTQRGSMSCWRRYRGLMIFSLFLHITKVQE